MPFALGNQYGNRFTSENQPDDHKKKHGPRRSDIVRQVLSLRYNMEDETLAELKASYPEIDGYLTGEEVATLLQLNKAILLQDTAALKLLLDSAYGQATTPIEHSGPNGGAIPIDQETKSTVYIIDTTGGYKVPEPDDDYSSPEQ